MGSLVRSNFAIGRGSLYLEQGKDLDIHLDGQSIRKIPLERVEAIMRRQDIEIDEFAAEIAANFDPEIGANADAIAMWLLTWREENYRS
jgi:hypothetical protein